jgi:chromosome segregation ATPase
MSSLRLWGFSQVTAKAQPFQLDIVQRVVQRQMDQLFDTFVKDMTSTQNEINNLLQKVNEINQVIETLNVVPDTEGEDKLKQIEEKIEDANKAAESCNDKLKNLESGSLKEMQDTLQDLVNLKDRLDNIDNSERMTNFDMVDKAITMLMSRFTKTEEDIKPVATHTDEINNIKHDIEESQKADNHFQQIMDGYQQHIDTIHDMLGTNETQTLGDKVDLLGEYAEVWNELPGKVTALETFRQEIGGKVTQAEESLGALKTQIEAWTGTEALTDVGTLKELPDKVTALETFKLEFSEKVTQAEDVIGVLKTDVEAFKELPEKVSVLETFKREFSEKVTQAEDVIGVLKTGVEALNELPDKITALETFKQEFSEKVTQAEESIASIKTGIESLNELSQKVVTLETFKETITSNVTQIESLISAVNDSVSKNNTAIETVNSLIESVKNKAQEDIGAVNQTVETIQQTLEALKDDNGHVISSKSLQSVVLGMKSRIEDVAQTCSNRESTLFENIRANQQNITDLDRKVNNLPNNVSQEKVDELSEKMEALEHDVQELENDTQDLETRWENKVNDLNASLDQEKELIKSIQKDCDLNTVARGENKTAIESMRGTMNAVSSIAERARHIPVVIQLSSWGDIVKNQPIHLQNGEDQYMLHVEGTIKQIVVWAQHSVICTIDSMSVTTMGSQRPEVIDYRIRVNMHSIIRFNATENMDNFYAELYIYPRAP